MTKNRTQFDLSGKNVVVTGAAGLLGQRHAEVIAEYGGLPILLDIDAAKLENLGQQLKKTYGIQAPQYVVDIGDETQVRQCAEKVHSTHKSLHGLINNAAVDPKVTTSGQMLNQTRLENFQLDRWDLEVKVGLTGSFLCTKYFGALIAAGGKGGAIINISSDLGIIAPDQRLYAKPDLPKAQQNVKPVTYSVIKTGLIGLTRYVATYWAEENIRCNALCPAGVFNDQPETFVKDLVSRIPLGRMAEPDEYKGAIVFLLSDASRYMTGSALTIDGGRSCW